MVVSTCPACFKQIKDKSWILFSNAKYHKECFTCHTCFRMIGAHETLKHDKGLRTCVDCAKKDDPSIGEAKTCHGCDKAIDKAWVIGLEEKWHSECFKCCECSRVIDPKEKFYKVQVDGKSAPKCSDCKVVKGMDNIDINDRKCAGCDKELSSGWVVAMNKHWHHACFKCSHCDREIDSKEKFVTNLGKPVCMGCNNDHFRTKCTICDKPIVGTALVYKDSSYHHSCVSCFACEKAFEEGDHENIRIVNGKDFKHADCTKS